MWKTLLLFFLSLPATAQTDTVFAEPVQGYILRHQDAVLIRQLPKLLGSSRKCPYCVKLKQTSRVYFGVMYCDTLRAESPYYDEKGKLVAPDVNTLTASFYCTHKHLWMEEKKGSKKVITRLPDVER